MSDVLGEASANGGQQSQSQHMLPMFQIADPVSCLVGVGSVCSHSRCILVFAQ